MPRESAEDKLIRMTEIETEIVSARGISRIAGMDEVGRGPLAGPVVTACVCVPLGRLVPGVDDSKKLSEARREALYPKLLAAASYAKTAWVPPEIIDEINILNATKRAMEECAAEFDGGIILVDAVEGLRLPVESRSIVRGDAVSYMIAAASVVAKVERDRYMIALDEQYPQYGFRRNKGYGTAEHIRALREYGPCPAHRRSFIGGILGGTPNKKGGC